MKLIESILEKQAYDLEKTIRRLSGILDGHRRGPSTRANVADAELPMEIIRSFGSKQNNHARRYAQRFRESHRRKVN